MRSLIEPDVYIDEDGQHSRMSCQSVQRLFQHTFLPHQPPWWYRHRFVRWISYGFPIYRSHWRDQVAEGSCIRNISDSRCVAWWLPFIPHHPYTLASGAVPDCMTRSSHNLNLVHSVAKRQEEHASPGSAMAGPQAASWLQLQRTAPAWIIHHVTKCGKRGGDIERIIRVTWLLKS
jgi:hypothetical protein